MSSARMNTMFGLAAQAAWPSATAIENAIARLAKRATESFRIRESMVTGTLRRKPALAKRDR